MDVLDSTHKVREEEFAKQREELAATKKAKDAEIFELRSEVLRLRSKVGTTVQQIRQADMDSLIAENAILKKKLEINKLQLSMGKERGGRQIGSHLH